MNQRQFKKLFKNQINSVVDLAGENLRVICGEEKYSTIYYNLTKKSIGFNIKPYIKHYNQFYKPSGITLKESIITSVLHEIGHHKDQNLKPKYNIINEIMKKIRAILDVEIKIEIKGNKESFQDRLNTTLPYVIERGKLYVETEKTAWENAYILNKKYDLVTESTFLFIKNISLNTYSSELNKAIDKYNKLENKFKYYEEFIHML